MEKTVQIVKPIGLTITPSPIKVLDALEEFTIKFQWTAAKKVQPTPVFTVAIEKPVAGLEITSVKNDGATITVGIKADPGTFQDDFAFSATASEPFARVLVPFEVTVRAKVPGLLLEKSREVSLGAVKATTGAKTVTWTLESKDTQSIEYRVEVRDLSNGNKVLPLRVESTSLKPVKDRPASLMLTTDIGNVPTGHYTGTVILKYGTHSWETKVSLRVEEPLVVAAIDLGMVAPGQIKKLSVPIKNLGGQTLANIKLTKPFFTVNGDAVDVALQPERIDAIIAGKEKEIALSIALGADLKTRGEVTGTLVVNRLADQKIDVPVKFRIVDQVEEKSQLIVAPEQMHLSGAKADILRGDLRVKLASDAPALLESIRIEVGNFIDMDGKTIDIDVTTKFTGGAKLSKNTPLEGQIVVIAPEKRGTYQGVITIRSDKAGAVRLPIKLTIQ